MWFLKNSFFRMYHTSHLLYITFIIHRIYYTSHLLYIAFIIHRIYYTSHLFFRRLAAHCRSCKIAIFAHCIYFSIGFFAFICLTIIFTYTVPSLYSLFSLLLLLSWQTPHHYLEAGSFAALLSRLPPRCIFRYLRRETVAVGKLALNLTHIPDANSTFITSFRSLLQQFVTHVRLQSQMSRSEVTRWSQESFYFLRCCFAMKTVLNVV